MSAYQRQPGTSGSRPTRQSASRHCPARSHPHRRWPPTTTPGGSASTDRSFDLDLRGIGGEVGDEPTAGEVSRQIADLRQANRDEHERLRGSMTHKVDRDVYDADMRLWVE